MHDSSQRNACTQPTDAYHVEGKIRLREDTIRHDDTAVFADYMRKHQDGCGRIPVHITIYLKHTLECSTSVLVKYTQCSRPSLFVQLSVYISSQWGKQRGLFKFKFYSQSVDGVLVLLAYKIRSFSIRAFASVEF